jgi:hypothetical protein
MNGDAGEEEGSETGGVEGECRDVRRYTPRKVVKIWDQHRFIAKNIPQMQS